ncbi:MAG: DUF1501 domain-containing protein [Bacteroidota bacterium]
MKRRNFLRIGSLGLPVMLNGIPVAAMCQNSWSELLSNNDKVLVLIQLSGGNDGLNTFLPMSQYDKLAKVRSNIIIPKNQLIKTPTHGFHPSLALIKSIYDNGKMGILQSVGYPNQNRSHFRSTDIWTTGSSAEEVITTGWLGRYFELEHPTYPEDYPNNQDTDPFAVTLGSLVSNTCQGTVANFSLAVKNPNRPSELTESGGENLYSNLTYGQHLKFLKTNIAQTNAYGEVIGKAAEKGNNLVNYTDENRLSQQLKNVALMISGGLATKVYAVNLGGFDTHAAQVLDGEPTQGEHAELLTTLSQATTEFMDDLRQLGLEERVLTMTFSEFGRRIQSNDSFGTDHGSAAPLMLFGSCVRQGFIGDEPEIPNVVDIQDGVAMQYDFRDVYGSVLMDWFGAKKQEVKDILFEDFRYVSLLNDCSTTGTTSIFADEPFQVDHFPNPFTRQLQIEFESKEEWITLSIFDEVGKQVSVLVNERKQAGRHRVTFNAQRLPAGNYYYHLLGENGRRITKLVVKI